MSREVRAKPHVLIVDGGSGIGRLATETLRAAGLEVVAATRADQALDLAGELRPDIVVADLSLPGEDRLELIHRLRARMGRAPIVIIAGDLDSSSRPTWASQLQPVTLLGKPLEPARLQQAVLGELGRHAEYRRVQRRVRKLRTLARHRSDQQRRSIKTLRDTCDDLFTDRLELQARLERMETVIGYQTDLLGCQGEDDIFCKMFQLFVSRTGPVFGVALLCDENAELQMVGRFGCPVPDGEDFCRTLAMCTINTILENPQTTALDAQEHLETFPVQLHKMLIGVTLLLVPLMVGPGQLIGLVVLYRKGEQPFTDDDVALAKLIGPPSAIAAQNA